MGDRRPRTLPPLPGRNEPDDLPETESVVARFDRQALGLVVVIMRRHADRAAKERSIERILNPAGGIAPEDFTVTRFGQK